MMISIRSRLFPALSGAALLVLSAISAHAQDNNPWQSDPPTNNGYGDGSSYSGGRNDGYANQNDAYSQGNGARGGYSQGNRGYGANDAYAPNRSGGYGGGSGGDAYAPSRDAYAGGSDAYSPTRQRQNDSYSDPGQPANNDGGGYGEPYAPPQGDGAPYREAYPQGGGASRHYEQNEIIAAGHGFFGAISQGLAQAVEYAFKSQGRPNGYILGEDAGGAFVVGLRYGEGRLYTKDAGDHKVFWQGPSMGYDAGAEGSKAMVLVYNMHDPSEIYNRFGGVQGAAYLVGGLSVQFQKYGEVTLAIIRSGVGLRLGANVGYLKYTRTPTWNPL
ncbi:DUF1134 domain-containing protein [Hyphomicrobium sp. LHD-15]|uniref:DUF1134 domain-containing protein n=1 Tax=Hyphomicrobium sp. LHD-15 TaxID=3072142 RepID=UPI00280EF9F6|nr:DUF1134 domain-containing protein [Hyphomicrobium sp. LHD-15]MDQ8697910.1 DUF1134 domain-containing protein [Hyphomicrobium sp. LHD-15]